MVNDDFSVASAVRSRGDGRFEANLPDGWQQGRGAFGGLVLGALARALMASEDDAARTLRALTGEVFGPVQPGIADVEVRALRRGNGMSTWEAWLSQEGEVRARATTILGRSRAVDTDAVELTAPDVGGPWHAVAVAPIAPPFGPAFADHVEFRPRGVAPFSSAWRSGAEGWVRFKRTVPLGMPELVALADAYWPARFAREAGPRPMATVAFTFEPLVDPATLDPAEPLYHRATSPASSGGHAVELRELWTARGELVALNQQTFAVIR